jgi:hypothetical protein
MLVYYFVPFIVSNCYLLSFKRSWLRNRPKSDTCLYELFSSQIPRKSPPAVMPWSRETPCIIHFLHIWFSYYRMQLCQLSIYILFPISSLNNGSRNLCTVVAGYIILMVQVCLVCMTEWVHTLCLMGCIDSIYTWWATHDNCIL